MYIDKVININMIRGLNKHAKFECNRFFQFFFLLFLFLFLFFYFFSLHCGRQICAFDAMCNTIRIFAHSNAYPALPACVKGKDYRLLAMPNCMLLQYCMTSGGNLPFKFTL